MGINDPEEILDLVKFFLFKRVIPVTLFAGAATYAFGMWPNQNNVEQNVMAEPTPVFSTYVQPTSTYEKDMAITPVSEIPTQDLIQTETKTPTSTPEPEIYITPTIVDTIVNNQQNKNYLSCLEPLEPCGFALMPIESFEANTRKGFHDGALDWSWAGYDWTMEYHPTSVERPTDVLSMLNGTVTFAGEYKENLPPAFPYTLLRVIVRNEKYEQVNLHCDEIYVTPGQEVQWGTPLCLMGKTGFTLNTHLHLIFQDLKTGQYIEDQTQWLK